MEFIKRHKLLLGAGAGVGLVVVAFLAFGVFGIHTLFYDNEVSEGGPVFASGVTAPIDTTEETASPIDEPDQPADDAPANETAAEEPASTPVVETVARASFADSEIHAGRGDAVVLSDGIQQFLRFEENFATDNGPDLNVYLRDGEGNYIDLGDLKGNIGSQNYEIPPDVDIGIFNQIDIWCVRFGVSFSTAELV
ncbi:MAG: DM13 domain-containing protein [Acidimicrobiales bacterium]|nr:DM13 domain-containing protein [Acidimicrobiales bacterium]